MDVYRTEEEQIDAIKNFIGKEGSKILGIIILGIASFFAFQYWQDSNQQAIDSASLYYSELSALTATGQALSDEQQATFDNNFANLLEAYPQSIYASYATLLKAKLEADKGDFLAASQSLQWVVEADVNDEIISLATLRRAQLALATEDYDTALALLDTDAGPFVAEYAELKGDVFLQQGSKDQALMEYKSAKDNQVSVGLFSGRILDVKISSLEAGDQSKLFPISASGAPSTSEAVESE